MKSALFVLLPLLIFNSFAGELAAQSVHPIEAALDSCYNAPGGYTTAGMLFCEQAAIEAWDGELNRAFQILMDSLPDHQREQLRSSQRNWLKYRDAETAWADQFYLSKQGSMYKVIAATRRREIVKARAEELWWYVEMLNP